jgi:hypothetical protein
MRMLIALEALLVSVATIEATGVVSDPLLHKGMVPVLLPLYQ